MTQRKPPTRAERKARNIERHEIVRSIMQEPDDVVHFPVAFGRIAMSAATWGAVALGILALGVLASAVILMRQELADLATQIRQKDADLGILSGELQKVRDQMFGEAEQAAEQGIAVRLVNAETGVASTVPGALLQGTNYPLGPESRAVNGKYLYWTDEEGILRVNLEDGTSVRLVERQFISSLAVSKDGAWLAYAYGEGLSDPESVGETRAVAMPLSGRGDALELGVLDAPAGSVPVLHGFTADGKELIWTTTWGEGGAVWHTQHRLRVANGQETSVKDVELQDPALEGRGQTFVGFSPDGNFFAVLEWTDPGDGAVQPTTLKITDIARPRFVAQYRFRTDQPVKSQSAVSWDENGAGVVFSDRQDVMRLTIDAKTETLGTGNCASSNVAGGSGCALLPDSWLMTSPLTVRNLSTGSVAAEEVSSDTLQEYVGWSDATASLVFLRSPLR